MSSSSFRTLIIGGLVALLAGCSALRLGYSQGPTLLFWWIDAYVDFDSTQSQRVREGLDRWFRWHRANQVGELADLLAQFQREAAGSATGDQFCAWTERLSAQLQRGVAEALPTAAEVALTLKPVQFRHMAQHYEKKNTEFREEFLRDSTEERLKASVERSVERAEWFYGKLDAAQRDLIARRVAASPFDPANWLAERQARQQDLLASLRRWRAEGASVDQVQSGLRLLAQQAQRSSRVAYRQYQQRLLDFNCAFAAELHNATTPVQRQRAIQKLAGWEADLRALVIDPGS